MNSFSMCSQCYQIMFQIHFLAKKLIIAGKCYFFFISKTTNPTILFKATTNNYAKPIIKSTVTEVLRLLYFLQIWYVLNIMGKLEFCTYFRCSFEQSGMLHVNKHTNGQDIQNITHFSAYLLHPRQPPSSLASSLSGNAIFRGGRQGHTYISGSISS